MFVLAVEEEVLHVKCWEKEVLLSFPARSLHRNTKGKGPVDVVVCVVAVSSLVPDFPRIVHGRPFVTLPRTIRPQRDNSLLLCGTKRHPRPAKAFEKRRAQMRAVEGRLRVAAKTELALLSAAARVVNLTLMRSKLQNCLNASGYRRIVYCVCVCKASFRYSLRCKVG